MHTPLAIQTGYADYQPLFSAVAGLLASGQLRAPRSEACDVNPTLLPQLRLLGGLTALELHSFSISSPTADLNSGPAELAL